MANDNAGSASWFTALDGQLSCPACVRYLDERFTPNFNEHAESVCRYLRGLFGDQNDVEEVTQETFLRLYQVLLLRKPIDVPRAWLFTVSRRLMINRRKQERDRANRRDVLARDPAERPHVVTAEERVAVRERRAEIIQAWRALPTIEMRCVYLRAHGLTMRESGEELEISAQRVSEHLKRGLRTMREPSRD
jgi:RNA polymerase sigma-70 factor, ECF subfamily